MKVTLQITIEAELPVLLADQLENYQQSDQLLDDLSMYGYVDVEGVEVWDHKVTVEGE